LAFVFRLSRIKKDETIPFYRIPQQDAGNKNVFEGTLLYDNTNKQINIK